ncbi:MAG TPA: RNA methyltransferase [Verrucomicrobiae bacterium]
MVRVTPVQALDLPELAPYRTMRRQHKQREEGFFVAEGEKVVRRLIESELEIVSLLLPEKWFEQYAGVLEKRPEKELPVFLAERNLLEELTGFSFFQGVLAVARVPKVFTIEEVLTRSVPPRLLLAVDGVSSAENLGGLIRNCVAFGVNALLVADNCCSAWLRRSVRSSMGTIFKLPVLEMVNLPDRLSFLRKEGFHLIAAHAHAEERSVSGADFRKDCVIVLGSEGHGISQEVLKLCDEEVVIPMQNQVDSLNVATAGAIFLYEASRQRAKV